MKSETQIDATDLGLLVALEPCHVFFVIPPRLLLQLTGGKVLLVCALKTHLLAHTVTRAMPKLLPAGNRKRKKVCRYRIFRKQLGSRTTALGNQGTLQESGTGFWANTNKKRSTSESSSGAEPWVITHLFWSLRIVRVRNTLQTALNHSGRRFAVIHLRHLSNTTRLQHWR